MLVINFDPTKHLKISESDLQDRKYWDNYMESYEEARSICSTKLSPWYIILQMQNGSVIGLRLILLLRPGSCVTMDGDKARLY